MQFAGSGWSRACLRNVLVLTAVCGTLGGAGLTPLSPVEAHAQFQQQPGFPPGTQPNGRGVHDNTSPDDPSGMRKRVEEKQAQARNDDRQKRLVSDSERLLALATELHEEVLKTDKNILSVDVVKKATEMEKLSHDLKERMRG